MTDIFGKSLEPIKEKKIFLLDMDGTIYLDELVIDGTYDFLHKIKLANKKVIYITNNSSKSVKAYLNKLLSLGILAGKDDFYTSSMAMATYINALHFNKKVYCMGTKSLIEEFLTYGINVTIEPSSDVEVVVLGYDTELTYQKLVDVSLLLKNEKVVYLATNIDKTCPTDFGFVPDCGSMAKMLEYATGRIPKYIGKPDPMMIFESIKKSGFNKEDAVVVGDRLHTDILSGVNAGVDTICVLTGESTIEEVIAGNIKPTFVTASIKEIAEIL